MKKFILAFLLTAACFAEKPDPKEATEKGEAWLAQMDAGKYSESWAGGSAKMHQLIPKDTFVSSNTALRQRVGALESRKLKSTTALEEYPGLGPGAYVILAYDSAFAQKKPVSERLIMIKDGEEWKPLTYMLR